MALAYGTYPDRIWKEMLLPHGPCLLLCSKQFIALVNRFQSVTLMEENLRLPGSNRAGLSICKKFTSWQLPTATNPLLSKTTTSHSICCSNMNNPCWCRWFNQANWMTMSNGTVARRIAINLNFQFSDKRCADALLLSEMGSLHADNSLRLIPRGLQRLGGQLRCRIAA